MKWRHIYNKFSCDKCLSDGKNFEYMAFQWKSKRIKFTLFRHFAQAKLFFLTNTLHRLKISQPIESGTHFCGGPFIPQSYTTTQSCFDTIFFAQMQSGWQKNYKRYSPVGGEQKETNTSQAACLPWRRSSTWADRENKRSMHKHSHTYPFFHRAVCNGENKL
jgi:hypothetical protein